MSIKKEDIPITDSQPSAYHTPVLIQECIDGLHINPEGVYVDCTFGGGGHSSEILKHLGEKGKLVVFDQDEDAKKNLPDDEFSLSAKIFTIA